jgi:ATP-dependent RNA helicase DeaD
VCVLIVPENRRGAAQRVLSLAKLTALVRAAPGIAEIEARYRREILDTVLSADEPNDLEAAFVAELLGKAAPERIAAAFLRQQLSARPVPEDLSPLPVTDMPTRKPRHDRRTENEHGSVPAREPRGPDMEGGIWFSLSLGRKQRADPKWLLPMICKAGGVSRRDVGSIRIDDTETRFEIAADKAAGFTEQINRPGSTERGIVIAPAGEVLRTPWRAKPKFSKGVKPAHRGKAPPADRDHARKHKGKPKRPG